MFSSKRQDIAISVALLPVAFIANLSQAQTARNLDEACSAVARLALPQTRITRAEAVHVTGEYAVPGTEKGIGLTAPVKVHRSFCRVAGVVEPAINFETWMPLENWNGRFQGFGLGAFYGKLPYTPMAQSLDRGYAVGGTDTGHQSESDDGTWAMSNGSLNQQVVEDWAHRGIHEMSVKSQAIVESVYGRPAEFRYFTGCSSGGFQAMTEAQRYPSDYDGILAGAPANYITHLQAAQISFGLATQVDPDSSLITPTNKLPMLHEAVLAACDAQDGAKDGLIENPGVCRFRPAEAGVLGRRLGDVSDGAASSGREKNLRRYQAQRRIEDLSRFPARQRAQLELDGQRLSWKHRASRLGRILV